MRDSQRQAVYRWEDVIFDADRRGPLLTLEECQELVRVAWRRYMPITRVPRVKDGRGRRRGCWDGWDLRLPRATRHAFYVLHEVAHGLVDWHFLPNGKDYASHGPEFARVALELYDHHLGVLPRSEMRRLGVVQRPRRVRFTPVSAVPRPLKTTALRRIDALIEEAARHRARLAAIKFEQNNLLKERS